MYIVEERAERRALASRRVGTFFAKLTGKIFVPALIGLAGMTAPAQSLAPINDNFANAQVISGTVGSVRGTDVGATAETGEPPHNGVGAANSIWYAWTAPSTAWYTFDTRGSTDSQGNDLNTVLGVYTNPPIDQLGPVATSSNSGNPNDDDPSGGVTSRVDFQADGGTVYYIAVDSSDGVPPGSVVLNWHNSPNSGTFKWASGITTGTAITAPGPFPDFNRINGFRNNAGVWPFNTLYLAGQNDGSRQLTVTRAGGFSGRVYVDVAVSSTVYTNRFTTNWYGTNIFTTNYDALGQVISFTNLYSTNIAYTNRYQDNLYGEAAHEKR